MNSTKALIAAGLTSATLAGVASGTPAHKLPASKEGNLVVGLCDGETTQEVKGVKPGQPLSRAQALAVSDALMAEWKKKHPDAKWDEEERLAQADQSAHGATTPRMPGGITQPGNPQPGSVGPQAPGAKGEGGVTAGPHARVQEGHTYGAFTSRDEEIWKASVEQVVEQGNRVFHDSKLLGGTIAVSCDMCHPNAANTHPETYPKFQVQLGRVALLRDMINWCIENPVRGKPLADEDPRMKALEAYITAQRKGVPLEYGKH